MKQLDVIYCVYTYDVHGNPWMPIASFYFRNKKDAEDKLKEIENGCYVGTIIVN